MSEVFSYLRKNGPSSLKELPVTSVNARHRREYPIWRVRLQQAVPNHTSFKAVYYLYEWHEPENVVRKILEVNEFMLDNLEPHEITRHLNNHDSALADAWRHIRGEYDVVARSASNTQIDQPVTQDCPFCGKEIPSYAVHLQDCPEAI